jgi:hypothetical protein
MQFPEEEIYELGKDKDYENLLSETEDNLDMADDNDDDEDENGNVLDLQDKTLKKALSATAEGERLKKRKSLLTQNVEMFETNTGDILQSLLIVLVKLSEKLKIDKKVMIKKLVEVVP